MVQDGLTVAEKMKLWQLDPEPNPIPDVSPDSMVEISQEQQEGYSIAHFPDARKFLIESEAYQWLLARLQSELILTNRKGTTIDMIRTEVHGSLKDQIKTRDRYNRSVFNIVFELEWNPQEFLREQFSNFTALGEVIVISGSETNAQALSCSEYLRQVWPKTGLEVLKTLERSGSDPGLAVDDNCQLSDGS